MTDANATPLDLDAIRAPSWLWDIPSKALAKTVKACDITYSLDTYWLAPAEGELNYTWQDKPHRLLCDLVAYSLFLRDEISSLIERAKRAEASAKSSQQAFDDLKEVARADWQRAQKAEARACVLAKLEEIVGVLPDECLSTVQAIIWEKDDALARIKTLETTARHVAAELLVEADVAKAARHQKSAYRAADLAAKLLAALSTTDAQPQAWNKGPSDPEEPLSVEDAIGAQPDPRDERIKELLALLLSAWNHSDIRGSPSVGYLIEQLLKREGLLL